MPNAADTLDALPGEGDRPAVPLTVAVLGATGSTVGLVVEMLLRRGHRARAVSRSPYPAAGSRGPA